MEIYIIRKKSGSRKELGRQLITLNSDPETLFDILHDLTRQGLIAAQAQPDNTAFTDDEIVSQAEEGRIRLAEGYGENYDTLEKALQRTLQAYEDSLFRVFIDGEEADSLDAPIALDDGSEVVFLRMTMLTGLYFAF
ncbi:hypothetical protein [Prevotella dentasini]|uniref:hypothetical protein n=1 Tax=Prevotella dentasini TaxID=589537 RepID=UPI0004692D95|nr:hypothetical protein [Prevotella dentasini]